MFTQIYDVIWLDVTPDVHWYSDKLCLLYGEGIKEIRRVEFSHGEFEI